MYWDPDRTLFFIPYLHWPIRWYGLFFASGFMLGIPLFVSCLRRFFFLSPKYIEAEILCPEQSIKLLNQKILKGDSFPVPLKIKKFVQKSRPPHPEQTLSRLGLDLHLGNQVLGIYRKATLLTDRFVLYMLLGTVIGARLGHLFFYEDPSRYWGNFYEVIALWEGGLASHGAALGIMLALIVFRYRICKMAPTLSWVRLLDFVSIPTALCGALIRVGNFFNQEILGTATTVPWGVTFGSPLDGGVITSRHPVQIYEAIAYFLVFCLLQRLSYIPQIFAKEGRIIGLFFILVFGARFALEGFKEEQSFFCGMSCLTMGQLLSLPLIFLGGYFLSRAKKKRSG